MVVPSSDRGSTGLVTAGASIAGVISSVRNPRVAEALKLRKRGLRDERRRFLVEGPQAVEEALHPGRAVGELFVGPESAVHPVVALAREADVPVPGVSGAV